MASNRTRALRLSPTRPVGRVVKLGSLNSLAPVKAILKRKSVRVAMVVFVAVAGVTVPFVVRALNDQRDRRMTASCANHAIQLKFLVMSFIETNGGFPSQTDTRNALAMMDRSGQLPSNWFSSYGSSCPESYRRDQSIGYLFVADSLATKDAVEHSALVFLCPADSHQSADQHCHAMFADGLRCLKSNAEMMAVLRAELSRAKSGAVSYSTNARRIFERELAARENYEWKREPPHALLTPRSACHPRVPQAGSLSLGHWAAAP